MRYFITQIISTCTLNRRKKNIMEGNYQFKEYTNEAIGRLESAVSYISYPDKRNEQEVNELLDMIDKLEKMVAKF